LGDLLVGSQRGDQPDRRDKDKIEGKIHGTVNKVQNRHQGLRSGSQAKRFKSRVIRAQFCPDTCITFLTIWRDGQKLNADGQSDFELDYPEKLERQILRSAVDRIEFILDLEEDE
jgi:hypothetical protein